MNGGLLFDEVIKLKGFHTCVPVIILIVLLIVPACSPASSEERLASAQKLLNDLKHYSTDVIYEVFDKEEVREYRFRQWVEMPDRFKIQVVSPENLAGKVITRAGGEVLIEHPGVSDSFICRFSDIEQGKPLFIGDFLADYWLSEEVEKRVEVDKGVEYFVFSCPVLDNAMAGYTRQLWVHGAELKPARLMLCDEQGFEVSRVIFENFNSKWTPAQDFFKIR